MRNSFRARGGERSAVRARRVTCFFGGKVLRLMGDPVPAYLDEVPKDASRRSELTWLILAFHLPPQPGYLRVKIWRRLQSVGAVSVQNALYILPGSEDAREEFSWILREVQEVGGDGAIFEAKAVAGLRDRSCADSSTRHARETIDRWLPSCASWF